LKKVGQKVRTHFLTIGKKVKMSKHTFIVNYIILDYIYIINIHSKNEIYNHFTLCAWSNENCYCGPDTCLCAVINYMYSDLKKILIDKQKSLT